MGSVFFKFALRCSFLPEKWDIREIFCKTEKMIENSAFWAKGCILEQIWRKQTPLKIKFYCPSTSLTSIDIFYSLEMASVWLWSHFYTFLPCNQQFAAPFSYCFNSFIFQHYVKCDNSRIKCWMCRWGTIASNAYFLSK